MRADVASLEVAFDELLKNLTLTGDYFEHSESFNLRQQRDLARAERPAISICPPAPMFTVHWEGKQIEVFFRTDLILAIDAGVVEFFASGLTIFP